MTVAAAGHAPTGGCVALQNRAVLHGLWTTWITWATTTVTTRDCVHLSRHLILPAGQPRTLSSHSSFLLIELILIYKHTTPARSSSCILRQLQPPSIPARRRFFSLVGRFSSQQVSFWSASCTHSGEFSKKGLNSVFPGLYPPGLFL